MNTDRRARAWRGAGRGFVLGAALCAALVCAAPAAGLEPPTQHQIDQYRKDGSLTERIRSAEALGNQRVAPQLERHLQNVLRDQALGFPLSLAPPPAWRGMPTTGTVNVLALCISFNDYPPSNSIATIRADLFRNGNPASAPYDSLRNYYRRSSYNQLQIQGDVLGWYNTGQNRNTVNPGGGSPDSAIGVANREALIKQALNFYDTQGFDFSPYDNDHDGTIDYLVVIWTGPDTGWVNFWWGYQTVFTDSSYKLDGKSLGTYSWQWEANPYPGTFDPLVVMHETGHALGLPDLYDYDPSAGPGGGVGGLDMMDNNWGDHNCFSKFLLGWLTPTTVDFGTNTLTLAPSGTSQDAAVVMRGVAPGNPFAEFFMVQNRAPVGNDTDYPGAGLLVWHIDARLNAGGTDYRFDNSYTSHKLVRLMEADGTNDIELRSGWANAGDYYHAGGLFSATTNPNSKRYDGSASGVTLSGITAPGASIDVAASAGGSGIDTTPPTVGDDAPAGWRRVPVTVTLTAADGQSGVAHIEYSLDGGGFVSGTLGATKARLVITAPTNHTNDGVHTIAYRAVDNRGNPSADASCTVKIDTLGPYVTSPSRVTVRRYRSVTLKYEAADALSPTADVTIKIRTRGGRLVKTLTAAHVTTNTTHGVRFTCKLARGTYRFFVLARDRAGNPQSHYAWRYLFVQ